MRAPKTILAATDFSPVAEVGVDVAFALLGSVAASLIRTSSVAVLVVGQAGSSLAFATIVAGIDLSPVSKHVLEVARTYVATGGRVEPFGFTSLR